MDSSIDGGSLPYYIMSRKNDNDPSPCSPVQCRFGYWFSSSPTSEAQAVAGSVHEGCGASTQVTDGGATIPISPYPCEVCGTRPNHTSSCTHGVLLLLSIWAPASLMACLAEAGNVPRQGLCKPSSKTRGTLARCIASAHWLRAARRWPLLHEDGGAVGET